MKLIGHLSRRAPAKRTRGFALVVTLIMMVLVAVIALGLLSLSTVSLRATNSHMAMSTARANAKMALALAVADLQKYTGPDQRVTAPARILDTDPSTPEIEGVTSPEWVGVWSTTTTGLVTDESRITRGTGNETTYIDSRDGSRPPQMAFLVSGNPTSANLERPANSVTLVSGRTDATREVWAPKVEVWDNSAPNNTRGSYAYWVQDSSTTIPLALWNRNNSQSSSLSAEGDTRYSDLLSPAGQTASVIPGLGSLADAADANLQKAPTAASAILSASDSKAIHDLLQNTTSFHSVGEMGYGLLADSLNGGLRANLTAYLNSGGSVTSEVAGLPGISDADAIINHPRRSRFSPKFALLRDYWGLADKISGGFTNPSIEAQLAPTRADGYGPERQNRRTMEVHPVVTEYSIYLDLVFHPTDRCFYLMVFPRVTLYNPYNVKIEARPYHIQIYNRLHAKFAVSVKNPASNNFDEVEVVYENYFGENPSFGAGARNKDLCFYLEAATIEPGEALVFVPKPSAGVSVLSQRSALLQFPSGGNMTRNVLSSSVPLSDMTSFYTKIDNVQRSNETQPTYRIRPYLENGFHFGYESALAARIRTRRSGSSLVSSMASLNSQWPVIQALDSDQWFRANNGRWRDHNQDYTLYRRDEFINNGVGPNPRTQFGWRLKWFGETDANLSFNPNRNWNAAPLANFDIRSSYTHRNPWDFPFRVSNLGEEFCWGQYAIDTLALNWTDPDVMPTYVGGKNRISPFFRSTEYSGNTFPLFDLPRKELPPVGMAQLRHAHLSAFSYWPSFIIGESYATPLTKRKKTGWNNTEVRNFWRNSVQQHLNAPWWEKNGNAALSSSDFDSFFDVSYELNHALWDPYFLTGLDGTESGWANEAWNPTVAMPNPRLVPNPFSNSLAQKDSLLSHRKAAKELMIEAPFNVNTADAHAWASLLKSFRGLDIPTRSSSSSLSETEQAFATLLVPEDGGNTSVDSTSSANWSGFQKLSDTQIDLMAESLVREVKARAPFISLSDFINRRLVDGVEEEARETVKSRTGRVGAIQAALDDRAVGINNFVEDYPMPQDVGRTVYPIYADQGGVEERAESSIYPPGKAAFSGGFVSQGDVLAKVGHVLTARGDTFVVRAYGDASEGGNVIARAWCEAVVQRLPEYVDSHSDQPETAPKNLQSEVNKALGRRYRQLSFRWLSPEEI
jgi:type II secretory pathway pseudopilin PulG